MNKSVVLIMAGALVVAIIVALIVQAKLAPKQEAVAAPTTEILVATKPLTIGTNLQADNVKWQAWPDTALYPGVIKKSEQADPEKPDVYDRPLRRSVELGEPVTRQAMIDIKGSNNFLAASMGPGMRAVGISVKAEMTAGGFIGPGDHVDVILAYTPDMGDAADYAGGIIQRYATQTVLSNVRVLAVDQVSTEENREAKIGKTVTLEVTREGAETLFLAQQMGEISLALRRIGEADEPVATVNPLVTDIAVSDVLKKVNTAKQKAKTQSNIIRVYTGGAVMNMPVRALTNPPSEGAGKAGQ